MYQLQPRVSETISGFLHHSITLQSLVRGFGTPLNIIFPQQLTQNIQSFQQVLSEQVHSSTIYYAHKANKSLALVKQAKFSKIGIDVASHQELIDALVAGFTGQEIEVTGPKSSELILLAIQHNCLIQADSLDELNSIITLHRQIQHTQPQRVMVRFNHLQASDSSSFKISRFGIPASCVTEVISLLTQARQSLLCEGLAFHLDTNTPTEKAAALDQLIQLAQKFESANLPIKALNIGGGFKLNYLQNRSDWEGFQSQLRQAALSQIQPITWHNSNFGISAQGGQPNIYDHYNQFAGANYLQQLLDSQLASLDQSSISQTLNDLMLNLIIEPGRALLDQVGITIAKVNFTKHSAAGDLLVGLDINRSNLSSTDAQMTLDPQIIHQPSNLNQNPCACYFVGNLCLESDFIYRQLTFLPSTPQKGDLVVFFNTAAYNSDFSESTTIQQKIAKKIAVIQTDQGFEWYEDHIYHPVLSQKESQ